MSTFMDRLRNYPWSEPADEPFWRALVAEMVGTAVYVFCGLCCIHTTTAKLPGASDLPVASSGLAIALLFGFVACACINIFGHVSGGHINPAVTYACLVAGLVSPVRALMYVMAQCIGGFVGTGLCMGVLQLTAETLQGWNNLDAMPSTRNPAARGFVIELILTSLVILAYFSRIDPSKAKGAKCGSITIGLVVAAAHMVGRPLTGCGINPARSLAPAILSSSPYACNDLWVFLLAPLLAGLFVGLAYPMWFAEKDFRFGDVCKLKRAAAEEQ